MFTSDKKRVGNYLVLNMNKLIVSNLDNMKVNDYLNIIIFIETANGNSIVTTLEDYKIINNNIIINITKKQDWINKPCSIGASDWILLWNII